MSARPSYASSVSGAAGESVQGASGTTSDTPPLSQELLSPACVSGAAGESVQGASGTTSDTPPLGLCGFIMRFRFQGSVPT